MSGRDDDERGERPKRSWAEIDRLRDRPRERRDAPRPRSAAAEARSRAATQEYLKQLDGKLFGPARGAKTEPLAAAVRAAHGTPGLADACRAYLAALGPPRDAALLGAFLDARDREVQRAALGALAEEVGAGRIALGGGLRAQVRTLAEGPDDALAEAAEALLDA